MRIRMCKRCGGHAPQRGDVLCYGCGFAEGRRAVPARVEPMFPRRAVEVVVAEPVARPVRKPRSRRDEFEKAGPKFFFKPHDLGVAVERGEFAGAVDWVRRCVVPEPGARFTNNELWAAAQAAAPDAPDSEAVWGLHRRSLVLLVQYVHGLPGVDKIYARQANGRPTEVSGYKNFRLGRMVDQGTAA